MNSLAVLTAVFLGALAVLIAYGSPTCAQQSTAAVTNASLGVDSVISPGSSIPVQLVRRGGGMGHSFRGGHVGRFHGLHRGVFYVGRGYYPYADYYGCGEGCYQEGNKTCVWNGYNYRCYFTPNEFY